jgi:hypothetical protein
MIQFLILILNALNMTLLSCKQARYRMWGGVVGCLGTPLWFYTTWQHEQWGFFILTIVYGIMYVRAIVNNRETRHGQS